MTSSSLVRLSACSLTLLAGLAYPLAAAADSGDGVGLGPVFAFSISDDDAPLLGWELSFSRLFPLGRGALGGAYPLSAKSSAPGYHYLVWEPWYFFGGTLGAALGNDLQPRGVYGVWGGYAQSVSPNFDALFGEETLQWVISFSAGWRGVGANHQLYITPKIWRIRGFRINS